jgi:uncharacterized membrane protein YgdD (TMEM256/DUF423 family)
MSATTRVNPTAVALGTVQRTFQQTVFKYVLSGAQGAIALTTTTATRVTEEIGTTSSVFQVAADGLEILTMGDRHMLDLDTLAIRVGNVLGAGSLTATGVWTFTAGGTLTVTEPTDLYGL